jgi:hypothetical protein
MMSSMNSTDFPPVALLGAALANNPPPTAAAARQAIPNVTVAETEYVMARRRSTRPPLVES